MLHFFFIQDEIGLCTNFATPQAGIKEQQMTDMTVMMPSSQIHSIPDGFNIWFGYTMVFACTCLKVIIPAVILLCQHASLTFMSMLDQTSCLLCSKIEFWNSACLINKFLIKKIKNTHKMWLYGCKVKNKLGRKVGQKVNVSLEDT